MTDKTPTQLLEEELGALCAAEADAPAKLYERDMPEIVRLKKEHGPRMQHKRTAVGVFAWKKIEPSEFSFWLKSTLVDHGDPFANATEKAGAQETLMRPLILWPVGADLNERVRQAPGIIVLLAGEALKTATGEAAERSGK